MLVVVGLARGEPSLTGSWVSLRCETRPGPQFVVRNYRWEEGGTVTGVLYHYADPDCRHPLHCVIFQAAVAQARPSWVLPGERKAVVLVGWYSLRFRGHRDHCQGAGCVGEALHRTVSSQVAGQDIPGVP